MKPETSRMTFLGMLLCTVMISQNMAGQVHWRYFGIYGVSNWSSVSDVCDSKTHARQSPIDIVVGDTLFDAHLTEMHFSIQKASDPDTITMVNNGHTINFNYDSSVARVTGGRLHGAFRVGGIHFHWGNNDTEGSEHTFDAEQYPMEMHVVTYDEGRFKGVLEASGGVNSIAVLGVLFTLSPSDNPVLNPIISHLQDVSVLGNLVKIPFFNIETLLPRDTSRYYRYLGSLTTPPCSESVIWSIFEEKQFISSTQLKAFRKVQEMVEPSGVIDYLQDNWRPPQPLYDRIIQRSFGPKYCLASTGVKTMYEITLLMMICAMFLLSV